MASKKDNERERVKEERKKSMWKTWVDRGKEETMRGNTVCVVIGRLPNIGNNINQLYMI